MLSWTILLLLGNAKKKKCILNVTNVIDLILINKKIGNYIIYVAKVSASSTVAVLNYDVKNEKSHHKNSCKYIKIEMFFNKITLAVDKINL